MPLTHRTVIEISPSRLKVARGVRAGRGMSLAYCAVRDIKGLPDEQVGQVLRSLRAERRIALPGDRVVLLIPRGYALVTYLNLPSQDLQELRQMAQLQAPSATPYSREELVIEVLVLSRDVSGYSRVMVVMVPLEIFNRHAALCAQAGCLPSQVTLTSFGLMRWPDVAGSTVPAVTLLVDLDDETSEVCVCRGGELLYSRQIQLGRAAVKAAGAPEFAHQLELTLSGYENDQVGPPPQRLATAMPAGSIDLKELLPAHRSTPLGVHAGVMPSRDLLARGFFWPEAVARGEVSVAAVAGAALAVDGLGLDLKSSSSRLMEHQSQLRRALIRAGAVLAAGLLVLAGALSLPFAQKRAELSRLEKELRAMKADTARVRAKGEQVAVLEALASGRLNVRALVRELYRIIPDDVVLAGFDLDEEGGLAMEGYSKPHEPVNAFRDALGLSALFTDVKIDYINKRVMAVGEVNYFRITCHVKGAV